MFVVLRGLVAFCRIPTDALRGFLQPDMLFPCVYEELTSLDLNIINQKIKCTYMYFLVWRGFFGIPMDDVHCFIQSDMCCLLLFVKISTN